MVVGLIALAAWYLLAHERAVLKKPSPVQISFYGDSVTRGDGLNPRPVQRCTELAAGAFVGVDYAMGGMTVEHASNGHPSLPYAGAFGDWILQDASAIVVIAHTGASAFGLGGEIDRYDMLLTAMINQAKSAGKAVVLVGATWVVHPMPGMPDVDSIQVLSNLAAFDDRTEAIAEREGCLFLDVRSVPFGGAFELMDNVHPGQAYSDRVSAYVVAKLLKFLEEKNEP